MPLEEVAGLAPVNGSPAEGEGVGREQSPDGRRETFVHETSDRRGGLEADRLGGRGGLGRCCLLGSLFCTRGLGGFSLLGSSLLEKVDAGQSVGEDRAHSKLLVGVIAADGVALGDGVEVEDEAVLAVTVEEVNGDADTDVLLARLHDTNALLSVIVLVEVPSESSRNHPAARRHVVVGSLHSPVLSPLGVTLADIGESDVRGRDEDKIPATRKTPVKLGWRVQELFARLGVGQSFFHD